MAAGSPVKTSELPLDLVSPPVEVDAPLDERDIELVQTTFAKVAAVGPEAAGRILFGHIFRIAPEAKGLFSFAKDEETMWLPGSRLEKHGARVVTTVGTAVSLLKDLDTLVPVLQKLGLQHVGYNVLPAHYDVVGQAFIATLGDALQAEFTEAVKNAYLKVWNVVQTTMMGDNYSSTARPCSFPTMPGSRNLRKALGATGRPTGHLPPWYLNSSRVLEPGELQRGHFVDGPGRGSATARTLLSILLKLCLCSMSLAFLSMGSFCKLAALRLRWGGMHRDVRIDLSSFLQWRCRVKQRFAVRSSARLSKTAREVHIALEHSKEVVHKRRIAT
eukprot:s1725_g7.t2